MASSASHVGLHCEYENITPSSTGLQRSARYNSDLPAHSNE